MNEILPHFSLCGSRLFQKEFEVRRKMAIFMAGNEDTASI